MGECSDMYKMSLFKPEKWMGRSGVKRPHGSRMGRKNWCHRSSSCQTETLGRPANMTWRSSIWLETLRRGPRTMHISTSDYHQPPELFCRIWLLLNQTESKTSKTVTYGFFLSLHFAVNECQQKKNLVFGQRNSGEIQHHRCCLSKKLRSVRNRQRRLHLTGARASSLEKAVNDAAISYLRRPEYLPPFFLVHYIILFPPFWPFPEPRSWMPGKNYW